MNIHRRVIIFLLLSVACLVFLVSCEASNKPQTFEPLPKTSLPVEAAELTAPASLEGEADNVSVTATGYSAEVDMGRLFFARHMLYGWLDLLAQDSAEGLIFDSAEEYHRFSSRELLEGPGSSAYQVFSHYSDQIAYWTTAGELWVSDAAHQEPKMILNDRDGAYVPDDENARLLPRQYIEIVWSPDDRHLLVYSRREPQLSRLYHLETGGLENWYWFCDSIILSSRSGRLATLCPKMVGTALVEEFAVLEWGGEIWFSDTFPGESFLEPTQDGAFFWQWSAYGGKLAYFDPDDDAGHLHISDAWGNVSAILPGISPFRRAEGLEFRQYEYFSDKLPFRWSRDADQLLVNGFGPSSHPCPRLVDGEYSTGLSFEWHCWQLVSVRAGDVIWNEADLARSLLSLENAELAPMGVEDITFAPDGRAIAIYMTFMLPRTVIVDLQTFQPTIVNEFDRLDRIYWGR